MNDYKFELKEENLSEVLTTLSDLIQSLLDQHSFPSILLSGELGSGKTTLVREWLKTKGSIDSANSPSFSLHNLYHCKNISIHHFDLYRLKDLSEIFELGFSEIWGQEGISFIEWWQLADTIIPLNARIYVEITSCSRDSRTYQIYTEKE